MSLRSNEYIKDITDFTEPTKNEKSEIIPFFAHTNILITGGTGFLGSLLIEKLLRFYNYIILNLNNFLNI